MKALMLFTILAIFMMSLAAPAAMANNATISSVTLQNIDTTNDTVDIKFDLSQDNVMIAGTDANGASFYDRVWIFAKYSTDSGATWNHAILTAGGSVSTYSGGVGITDDGLGASTDDGVGAFCSPGPNQTVRWNYGANSVADSATAQLRLFAIEMVLIPTGSFYAGDNATSTAAFKQGAADSDPWLVNDSADMVMNEGEFYYVSSGVGDAATGDAFTIPAAFPNGYDAFYIMKYEISQGQYADFLNTLTRAQQNGRTGSNVTTDVITNIFVMSNTATISVRSGIACPGSGNGTTDPITFGVDGDSDTNFNESDDGQWRAANYFSPMDLAAYADWAGLRPITELEHEKACRGGGVSAVSGEYPWGNTTGDYFSDLANDGQANEAKGATRANANYNYINATPDGPVRCGMFATSSSTKEQAGASYYGVMEMAGNMQERYVTIGNATGRSFDGAHGDGELAANGNANGTSLQYWPGYSGGEVTSSGGSGMRGGQYSKGAGYGGVSHRIYAAYARNLRDADSGGRVGRTEP